MLRAYTALLTSLAAVVLLGIATAASPENGANPRLSDITGTVIETIDAGRYTYVHVDTGAKKVWAVGPHTELQAGEIVTFSDKMPMTKYYSETLDRTFDVVYFVTRLRMEDTGREVPPAHSPQTRTGRTDASSKIDVSGIAKAEGGNTIHEIFRDKDRLAGQEVVVRGKVAKFTAGVMGKNWIHVRDGTIGPAGAEDLVITTTSEAEVGSVILVRGKISLDRDFGFGYRYDLLIEDASIAIE